MLAALRPEGVQTEPSVTGTSIGAALLFAHPQPRTTNATNVTPAHPEALRNYAALWHTQVAQHP